MTEHPDYKPCPRCRERGGDSTGDHFYRMKSNDVKLPRYLCRKCHYMEDLEGNPLGKWKREKGPTSEDVTVTATSEDVTVTPRVEFGDIESLPSLPDRGITDKVRKKYGVRSRVDPSTGDITHHYYPRTKGGKIVNWKQRDCRDKRFTKIKRGTDEDELFGMLSIRGTPRHILITEGEEDAMAADQMMDGKLHNLVCLSLPDGSGSISAIAKNLEWLSKADEIYFCPDNDDEGRKAIQKVADLIPDVRIIQDLGEKDANDMLMKGKGAHFAKSVLRSKKYQPPFLVQVSDVIGDAIKLPVHGRKWPWPTLDKATFGMRDGEGLYLGAGVKIGKSEFINELVKSRIQAADGDIPAVIKFEEQPAMTVRKIAGKIDGVFYHRPDIPFDPKDLERTAMSLDGKLFLYRSFGAADWDTVRYYIRYCVSEGSKTIIIDPITRLTNHLDSSQTETALRRISDELSCMAQDLGFFYVVTCHLKAPVTGQPHERGGKVQSNQFRGSRAMMEACYYMLGIERNKDPDLSDDERNTSNFVLLEDRAFGNSKTFPVFYDVTNGDYLEKTVTVTHLGE